MDQLKSLSLDSAFHSLPPRFLEVSQLLTLQAGQLFIVRDTPVEYAYIVLKGELYVFNETPDGKSSYWITMRAPTSISDIEVLSGQDRYIANVSAITSCTLLCCPIAEFVSLLQSDVKFLWMISSMLALKNFDLSYGRGHAAFRSSLERTVLYLLQHCAKYPPSQGLPTIVRKTRPIIASEIILSQKTVDRCLNQLRDQGYLTLVKGKVYITAAQYNKLTETWENII